MFSKNLRSLFVMINGFPIIFLLILCYTNKSIIMFVKYSIGIKKIVKHNSALCTMLKLNLQIQIRFYL